MTKVKIEPGICGLVTAVEAISEDEQEVKLTVKSGCNAVRDMMKELGDTFDAFKVCLSRPGKDLFTKYAGEHFPVHAACPVISGIIKCMEAECKLALRKDVSIAFVP